MGAAAPARSSGWRGPPLLPARPGRRPLRRTQRCGARPRRCGRRPGVRRTPRNRRRLTRAAAAAAPGLPPGTVYRGTWRNLPVAVKTVVFQDRSCGGEKAQRRAITEAAITSSVSHPNVVATLSYDLQPLHSPGAEMEAGTLHLQRAAALQGQVSDWCALMEGGPGEVDQLIGPSFARKRGVCAFVGGCRVQAARVAVVAATAFLLPWGARRAPRAAASPRPAAPAHAASPPRPSPYPPRRKLFLVQEFCNGGSLRQAVDSRSHYWDPDTQAPLLVRRGRAGRRRPTACPRGGGGPSPAAEAQALWRMLSGHARTHVRALTHAHTHTLSL
jgi:serine/threonine protein kinase